MPANKQKEPKDPIEAAHEEWFFNLDPKYFVQLTKEWNDVNLKIKLKKKKNYDDWLNYFKTLPPNSIRLLATTGLDILPTEAYAALALWHDIISNPSRIKNIHQSGLTNPKRGKSGGGSIVELARANDRLGVLKATRDNLAEKIEKGAGARDTAALAAQMTDVMTQIEIMEKRLGPGKDTVLGKLMSDMPEMGSKRSRDKGARNTSFKTRVTIEDVEGE